MQIQKKGDEEIVMHTTNVILESSPDAWPEEEKGVADAETPEGVTHKREIKETTVVVTRVVDKDGEMKEETEVTENKRVFVDGEEVKDEVTHLKSPEEQDGEKEEEKKEDDKDEHEKKEEEGEGGATAESPEPESPSKTKVKKKKSFKDALKKKFSKRGKDDHHEKTEKAEKAE